MLRKLHVVPVPVLAVLLALASVTTAEAAESRWTAMTVGEMCGGCVKRITAQLGPMPDVARVQCDIKTQRVFVLPHEGRTLSPRRLWEAMDEIGKTPKKLVGPSGAFTSKPRI